MSERSSESRLAPDGLALRNVSAGYGASLVLDDVTCAFGGQDVVGILGPNGSGKSTLLKTVMGLTRQYSGEIDWQGDAIHHKPTHVRAAAGLGYVPQVDNVFPDLTVEENLNVGGYLRPRREARGAIDEVFAIFTPLPQRRRIAAGALSGGERRMLAIGMALMMKPKCLLLDEPSADLSPAAIAGLFERLEVMRSTLKVPLVLVEQNVRTALDFTQRVVVLTRGRVRLEGPSSDVTVKDLGDLFLEVGRAKR